MHYKLNQTHLTIHNQQVHQNDTPLPLSPRGHSCLIELLSADNQTLSKDHLMKVLWQEVIVSDDSLFKVIQEVRKALVATGLEKDVLKNIYGQGYELSHVSQITATAQVSNHKRWWWVVAVVVIGVVLFYLYGYKNLVKHPDFISEEKFNDVVTAIETDRDKASLAITTLSQNKQLTDLDQLKLFYLKGLQNYQSGNYVESIKHLNQAISIHDKQPANSIIAKTYLLLAKIYVYREDKSQLDYFITQAKHHFTAINDAVGLRATQIERARYHQSKFEFDESVEVLQQVIAAATQHNDTYNAMRANANLAYSYERLGAVDAHLDAVDETLKLALELGDGPYAAYAYGKMSRQMMHENEPVKAMKFAQQAVNFVVAQSDTNVFQQGFSAYYRLLHQMGHLDLAKKYLRKAIEIQAHFNQEAVLVFAEHDLARAYVESGQYQEAQDVLSSLSAFQLTAAELLETEALLALCSLNMNDNISAYTKSKLVFDNENSTDRIKFQAGLVLAAAAMELERFTDAAELLPLLEAQANDDWRFEYQQYLVLFNRYHQTIQVNPIKVDAAKEQQQLFTQKIQQVKAQTQSSEAFTQKLDLYIKKIIE